MDNYPCVSIIIPTYKRSDKLPRAINSVLNQTYQNVEVIVVDDNNPDTPYRRDTEIIMEQFKDNERVTYLKHPCNKNGSAARNTGFRASRGEYIAFLDDDDEYLPNKVGSQVSLLESLDNSWAVCYTKYEVESNGKIVARLGETKEGDLLVDALMRNLMLASGSNLMVRRRVIEEINGFDESFRRNQDLEFLVRILQKYKIACVKKTCLRIHVSRDKDPVDFEKITEHYLESFKPFIDALPSNDREKVYNMINLQVARNKIVVKKDYNGVFNMIKEKKVRFFTLIRYFVHLFFRYIFKYRKGFPL